MVKSLYILGGAFDDQTHQFEFITVCGNDPPLPDSEVIVDREVIVHLVQRGHCFQAIGNHFPLQMVKVGREAYLRTDGLSLVGDYIEGAIITLKP